MFQYVETAGKLLQNKDFQGLRFVKATCLAKASKVKNQEN